MTRQILLIEDTPYLLEIMLKFLEYEGLEVIGTEDSRNGLVLAKEHIPNIIVCNSQMPVMNGIQLLSALREDSITAGIPVIFMINHNLFDLDADCFRELGVTHYLIKPFMPKNLVKAIAEVQEINKDGEKIPLMCDRP